MHEKIYQNNYAFIDSQNLNLSIVKQGWRLDLAKLRKYLLHKYKVTKIFIFIGYLKENNKIYEFMIKNGYTVVFKPTIENNNHIIKGNCDAELVLHCMINYNNFDKAIIVSGDGDFHCLVEYLANNNKLLKIGIPNKHRYSALLRKFKNYFFYFGDLKPKLEQKKREA